MGTLLLNQGVFQEHRLLPSAFCDLFLQPSAPEHAPYSALAWLHYPSSLRTLTRATLDDVGVQAALGADKAKALEAVVDKPLELHAFQAAVRAAIGADGPYQLYLATSGAGRTLLDEGQGEPLGFSASGTWGNYLVVCRHNGVVAARTVERSYHRPHNELLFDEFPRRVCSLP